MHDALKKGHNCEFIIEGIRMVFNMVRRYLNYLHRNDSVVYFVFLKNIPNDYLREFKTKQ